MQTFKNEPTAAPRTKANARKRNSGMDDSALKIPTSVTLVHVESNAGHEKQLSLGLGCGVDPWKRSVELREGIIGRA